MKKIAELAKKYKLTLIGLVVGAIGGYLYYYFIGCASGTCPITSSPVNSTIYGIIMGGLLFNIFDKKKEIKTEKAEQNNEREN